MLGSFLSYMEFHWDELLSLGLEHVAVVAVAVAIATALGVGLGVTTYRTDRPRELTLAVTGSFLTIPSLALFGLFIPVFGLGTTPVVVALVMYALLPIVRNATVGLRQVDPAVVESAQGMGMSRTQCLLRIELPLAWPVVLTGMRVSTLVIVGIAAIGAYISGPGLGNDIFSGLARIGSATALNLVLGGLLGVIVVAILFDLLYVLLFRLTTSGGIR